MFDVTVLNSYGLPVETLIEQIMDEKVFELSNKCVESGIKSGYIN